MLGSGTRLCFHREGEAFHCFWLAEGHNQMGSSIALRGLYKECIPGSIQL